MHSRRARLIVIWSMMTLPVTFLAQEAQEKPSPIPAKRADDFYRNDFVIPEFSAFGFLVTYFPSELVRNGIELKSYIRSRRFLDLRKKISDPRAVDAIYVRAMQFTAGNTAMALLYCCIATMDHRIVEIGRAHV